MGKQLACILIILLTNLSAQDTIYKKDGSVISAKIIEINTSDVKYKNSSNPDGPLYSLYKTDIFRIKYQNGMSDTFSVTPKQITHAPDHESAEPVAKTQCKILKQGAAYYCNDKRLNKGEMLMMVRNYAVVTANQDLTDTYNSYRLNKGLHTGLSVGAIPFFVAGGLFYVWGTFIQDLGGSSDITERGIVFLALVGVSEVGAITAFVNKNIRFNQCIEKYNKSIH